jgi:hypothetical protein
MKQLTLEPALTNAHPICGGGYPVVVQTKAKYGGINVLTICAVGFSSNISTNDCLVIVEKYYAHH